MRPETQGDYFDIPAKKPYYTKEDLEKEMEHLSAGLLSMDEKGTKDKIQEIFSHLSQEAMTKEQFKQVFSAFLYTLMQKNTALIPIIAGYKLSDNDLAAQIKNQPHISQLKQKMEQILLLYMEQLKKQQEKKEEYVVKRHRNTWKSTVLNSFSFQTLLPSSISTLITSAVCLKSSWI